MNSGNSDSAMGRLAGILYLSIIACGLFSEVFVRAGLMVAGDPLTTVTRIKAAALLYRLGFAADVLMLMCDAAVAVLFYQLFKWFSPTLAMLTTAFRMIQTAVLGLNLLNYYAPWLVLGTVADDEQQQSLIMLFLELHRYGYDLGLFFFGVANVLLGVLFVHSPRLPVGLGLGLAAAGLAYLLGSFVRFMAPQWLEWGQPVYLVALVAEVALCIWLLLGGGNRSPAQGRADGAVE